MQKAHNAAKNDFWHNRPDTSSPITETELNRIETNIDTIDDRVVAFDTTKANQSDLLTCVSSISLNQSTGILTITLKNGTTSTLDTGLAKLAVNFDYDDDPTSAHYQQIILQMKDGTYKYIDLSALITQYEFVNTSTIVWTIESDGKIKANVPNGSITAEKLQPNYLADITTQANRATGAVTSTESNRLEAEGWAKGTQNGNPVSSDSPYYENNAKFYKEAARQITGNKVDTFNGRDGMVVPAAGDYSIDQINPGTGAVAGQIPVVNANGDFELGDATTYFYGTITSRDNNTNTDIVNIPGYKLKAGTLIILDVGGFALTNGTKLNISDTGAIMAKSYHPSSDTSAINSIQHNEIPKYSKALFVYDGTFYRLITVSFGSPHTFLDPKANTPAQPGDSSYTIAGSSGDQLTGSNSRTSLVIMAHNQSGTPVHIKKIEWVDTWRIKIYFTYPLKEVTYFTAQKVHVW